MSKGYKYWKRWFLPMVITVFTIILSGCWNTDEIDDLAITNVLGVDYTATGEVEVSLAVIISENLFTQTSVAGSPQKKNTIVHTTTGKNIFEAIGKLSSSIPKRIYLGHVNTVIFGEQAARNRMESSLDFFRRENEFRPNIKILVTKGSAKDVLSEQQSQLEPTLGLDLQNMIKGNRYTSAVMVKDISQFMKDLSADTRDPITGLLIRAKQQGIDTPSGDTAGQTDQNKPNKGDESNKQTSTAISLYGTAVFKEGALKGFLSKEESRGLLWMQGEVREGIVVLDCGKKQNGTIALQIRNNEAKLLPKLQHGTDKMKVKIKVDADIGDLTCLDFNVNPQEMDRLNRQLEAKIKKEAVSVLVKAQKHWQADIFGFGVSIHQKHPKEWKQMAPQWRKGKLRELDVDLHVTANISRTGLREDPSKSNESR